MKIDGLLKDIRKSTGSASFSESRYGKIESYIDTGILALNRIISGDIYLGIPSGKVIVVNGESQTGKSVLCAQIASNALKQGYDHIFYFDSEGGALNDFFVSFGCDTSRIEQILLDSVEDATVKILDTYNTIVDFKKTEDGSKARFLMILDSLGNLVPTKLYTDVSKGKQVMDMGLRARLVNNLMKGLTIPALKSNTSMIVTNHVYADPSQMYPSKIKPSSGGLGKDYVATVTVQCTKSLEKTEDKDDAAYAKGTNLKFFTTKNRLCKPFYEAEMYIDFSKGVSKYDGLFDAAIELGFINQNGGFYTIPSYNDKKYLKKAILKNEELWQSFLKEFNEKSRKLMQYSSAAEIELMNEEIPPETVEPPEIVVEAPDEEKVKKSGKKQ